MKYRKKSIVIEAFQMTLERRWDNSEWPEWLHIAWNGGKGEGCLWPDPDKPDADGYESAAELVLGTLNGVACLEEGEWILRGVTGELYPCKPDIFEQTYEPVNLQPVEV